MASDDRGLHDLPRRRSRALRRAAPADGHHGYREVVTTERANPACRLRKRWTLTLVAVMLLLGCGYSREEPGLFHPPPSTPPSVSTTPDRDRPPEATNLQLPVLGERVWTTGEGLSVTVRFAVHAIRRIEGATILDWSVTPLPTPRLAVGATIPSRIDLGLGREDDGDQRIYLIDAAGQVYRPLSNKRVELFWHCLCTPLWLAQLQLRAGETRMLQTAFAPLPVAVSHVDVSMANLMPFWQIPVTAEGTVPLTRNPVDLARPAATPAALQTTRDFTAGDTDRRWSISVEDLQTGRSGTVLTWKLISVDDQPYPEYAVHGPPVSTDYGARGRLRSANVASGPELRPHGSGVVLRTKWSTSHLTGGYVECLCSHFGLWASGLRAAGGEVEVSTTYERLPARTTMVDVLLPGVGAIGDVPIRVVALNADRALLGIQRVTTPNWTYSTGDPPGGWQTSDWPTPLPDPAQLKDYRAHVDRVVDLPTG